MLRVFTESNKVKESLENNKFVFDFGENPRHTDISLDVFIKNDNIELTEVKSTCGCTVTSPEKVNSNLYKINIKYKDSHIVKPFSKIIRVSYNSNNINNGQIAINIKGIITK